MPSHSVERRREARTWLEGAIPDTVSTAFFGIQLSALVPEVQEQLHGAATKTVLLFLSLRLGPIVLLATYAVGTSLPQSDFLQTIELLM